MSNEQGLSERCGRCGAAVPDGGPVCSTCGALLDAYRAPSDTPASQVEPSVAWEPATRPGPIPGAGSNPITAEWEKALESESAEPAKAGSEPEELPSQDRPSEEQSFVDLAAPSENPAEVEPSSGAIADDSSVRPPPVPQPSGFGAGTSAVTQPRPRIRPATAPPEQTRPRKPGYVARGTVEPVLLSGAILLVLAICMVVFASLVSVGEIAAIGFVFGALGIVAVVVAVLVALIRHERANR